MPQANLERKQTMLHVGYGFQLTQEVSVKSYETIGPNNHKRCHRQGQNLSRVIQTRAFSFPIYWMKTSLVGGFKVPSDFQAHVHLLPTSRQRVWLEHPLNTFAVSSQLKRKHKKFHQTVSGNEFVQDYLMFFVFLLTLFRQ